MKTFWIPESPNHPGLYALSRGDGEANCTNSADKALKFDTREECHTWCLANTHPVFVPMEHCFEEPGDHFTMDDALEFVDRVNREHHPRVILTPNVRRLAADAVFRFAERRKPNS